VAFAGLGEKKEWERLPSTIRILRMEYSTNQVIRVQKNWGPFAAIRLKPEREKTVLT